MLNKTPESIENLKSVLNPHWHETFAVGWDSRIERIDAAELLLPERFDLAAKTLLARSIREGRDLTWAKEVYREHLDRWSGGKFIEQDGSGKAGFDVYIETLISIQRQMSETGWDSDVSVLPVSKDGVIHDGAHRTGVAIDLGLSVPLVKSNVEARVYDYRFFRACGVRDAYLDAMALEYCERTANSYIAYLFPVKGRDDERAITCLRKVGAVYYDREIDLNRQGVHNLVAQIYRGEPWLGTAANGFAGAESHVKNRFIPGQDVRCVFFQSNDLSAVVEAKSQIRDIYNQGNYPVHINDTHEEIVRVGRQILNANGRHFMNHGRPGQYPKTHQRLEMLRCKIRDEGLDPHDYIIDSSSVLALYGLRPANDLDYLHTGTVLPDLSGEFQSHNGELPNYPYTLKEILSDPRHYFFYDGVKVASLRLVAEMKEIRGEAKDKRDVELIGRIHQPDGWVRRLKTEVLYFFRTLPHRASKFRLKLFLMIPDGVKPVAKNAYRSLFKRS